MLLWALFPFNPYAYYQLLRVVCCSIFIWQASVAGSSGREGWAVLLGIAAATYNPVVPLRLEREEWAVVNVATALVLLVWAWIDWRWSNMRPAK
jgi:hypothetical protein